MWQRIPLTDIGIRERPGFELGVWVVWVMAYAGANALLKPLLCREDLVLGTGVPVLVVSVVFGLLWDRYRDLASLMLLHLAIDLLPTLADWFAVAR